LPAGTDVAIAFSTMGRLVESLLLWNTADFGMVELADQYCSISSVMPQKKNPVGLEIIRAESVKAHNTINAAFGVLKALPIANGREPNYIPSLVFDAVERFVFLAPVMGDIVSTLKIKPDVMLRKAQEGFSTMTELADEIVRQSDISFHASYVLVSRLVANTIARGLKANQITTEMIDEVAVELLKKPLNIPAEAVTRALDPVENVRVRSVVGGPAPVEVARMLKARDEQQAAMNARLQKRLNDLEAANDKLNGVAKEIVG